MRDLEKYRIFVPEFRRSLHIAKYRNEQKVARFHIVTYIIYANAQLLDFQSKSNLERVSFLNFQNELRMKKTKKNILSAEICLLLLLLSCLSLKAQNPGETVSAATIRKLGEAHFFSVSPIPDKIFQLMQGKTYKKNCSVARSELRYLRCLHVDKDGRNIVGEMVVNRTIAADVLDILRKLYDAKYPIERMRLIDYWDADDERAMRDNNSSSFNFRFISHTHTVSKHGRGLAIDINTLYNPYHKRLKNGKEVVEPATARPYLDRSKKHVYMIRKGDLCYRLFKQKGFRWGGDWKYSKDYQHFEK